MNDDNLENTMILLYNIKYNYEDTVAFCKIQ